MWDNILPILVVTTMRVLHACTRACARQSLDGAIIPARGLRAQPDGDVDHGLQKVRFEKL